MHLSLQRESALKQSTVGRWMIRNQALMYFPLLGLARVSWCLQGLQYGFPSMPTVSMLVSLVFCGACLFILMHAALCVSLRRKFVQCFSVLAVALQNSCVDLWFRIPIRFLSSMSQAQCLAHLNIVAESVDFFGWDHGVRCNRMALKLTGTRHVVWMVCQVRCNDRYQEH